MPRSKFRLPGGKDDIGEIVYRFENISVSGKSRKQMRLDLIYIEPEYRKRGLGTVIMNHVIEKAKKVGCKCIVISITGKEYDMYSHYDVRKKFFEKFGFLFDAKGNFGKLELSDENIFKNNILKNIIAKKIKDNSTN